MVQSTATLFFDRQSFLVIHENESMRGIIVQLLKSARAREIQEATSLSHAAELMQTFLPDIILLNGDSEAGDGIDFVTSLRAPKTAPRSNVRLIMLSGRSDRHFVLGSWRAGVDEFLLKPFSRTSLLGRIRAVIDNPREFIRCAVYVGPDRRRTKLSYNGEERRRTPTNPDALLSQEEIQMLMSAEGDETVQPGAMPASDTGSR